MDKVFGKLKKEPIFFITPDVKRGLGIEDLLPNYHIICSHLDPIIPIVRKQGANIFCLEENFGERIDCINNSGRILENTLVSEYIKNRSRTTPWIMFFKPSVKLDYLISQMGFKSIGNNSLLNERLENKINFTNLLNKNFPEYSIPNVINRLDKLNYREITNKLGRSIVIQFGHGWAGSTTFFIDKEDDFIQLKNKFPETWVRISKKIEGISILNNCCIIEKSVIVSPPALQISGIKMLSERDAVTCGRQWPAEILSSDVRDEIYNISQKFGRFLIGEGYKGIFGLDFLVEKDTGKVYLSEINARLTASTPFYTKLERNGDDTPLLGYHLAAFLGVEYPMINSKKGNESFTGSQITFRRDYPESLLNSLNDYGTYQIKDHQVKLINNKYYPHLLKKNEFVFCRRTKTRVKTPDMELSRIETRDRVLEDPGKLERWVKDILLTPDK